jgi:hypothetical protein
MVWFAHDSALEGRVSSELVSGGAPSLREAGGAGITEKFWINPMHLPVAL